MCGSRNIDRSTFDKFPPKKKAAAVAAVVPAKAPADPKKLAILTKMKALQTQVRCVRARVCARVHVCTVCCKVLQFVAKKVGDSDQNAGFVDTGVCVCVYVCVCACMRRVLQCVANKVSDSDQMKALQTQV